LPETARQRQRLLLSVAAFVFTWIPSSLVLGIDWGRSLRLSGADPGAMGPLLEGILNFAFLMAVPSLFVGLVVFVTHAAITER
jgi:hypothetical protein